MAGSAGGVVERVSDGAVERFADEDVERFRRDGFLVVEEGFLPDAAVDALRERFDALFAGDYATGIQPDEVNWVAGRDPEDVTRQICNGWRTDDLIAVQVLAESTGRLGAQLMGYRGTRLLQDNCLWKPPGARSLEYVRGSHRWPRVPPDRGSFHAPENWLAPLRAAAPEGVEPERVPVVVKAGGCAFHHSLTFHGSGSNQADTHRRALVSHLVPVEARFHPVNVDPVYSRYRRRADLSLDESYFPVLWDEDGGRSAWLSELPKPAWQAAPPRLASG
jgi:hypothetical protein